MPWTSEERIQIIGEKMPLPGFGYTGKKRETGPNWPVQPTTGPTFPDSVAVDGPRLISEYLAPGLKNKKIEAGLYRLEEQLVTTLRSRQAGTGDVVLATKKKKYTYDEVWTALPPAGSKEDNRRPLIWHLLRDALLEPLVAAGFGFAGPGGVIVPIRALGDDAFYGPM